MSALPRQNLTMTGAQWAMLVALSALWGGSFFFVGVAVKELPPFTIVTLRVTLAAACLLAIARFMGLRLPRERRIWFAFFIMGFLNNVVPFSLIVWGQTYIASGVASVLNATTPLFTVVATHYLTKDEKFTASRMIGVLLGFGGVVIMIGGAALHSPGIDFVALLAMLSAALSYALAGVFGRRFKQMHVPPLTTAAGQVTASSVMLLPVMILVDDPSSLSVPSIETIGALIGLAVLSTALAYVLYFRLLAEAGATNLLLVTFLIPVSAIVLGLLFLGEVLEPRHFAGMILIGIGLVAIDGRAGRLIRLRLSG